MKAKKMTYKREAHKNPEYKLLTFVRHTQEEFEEAKLNASQFPFISPDDILQAISDNTNQRD